MQFEALVGAKHRGRPLSIELQAGLYRRLAENSLGLMCCHDLCGRLIWVSPAAAEALGYPRDAGAGRSLQNFLAPETRALFPGYLERIRGNRADSGYMKLLTSTGEHRIFMYRNILSDEPNLPPHVLGHALDVTDQVEAQQELRALNAELEQRVAARTKELLKSNSDLEEFAYIASHDLQSPLNQIRTALDRLSMEPNGSDAADLLREASAGAQRMSKLIDNLLRYAILSNEAGPPGGVVKLSDALNESLLGLASAISESGATVECGELPAVLADRTLLAQLFQNLIGNAIKYRSSEPPSITISAEERSDCWVCTVEDNGIGIRPEHLEHIFAPLRRLHSDKYSGSGLGLAICRKIVERNGGTIWAESRPEGGSRFRFTLPR